MGTSYDIYDIKLIKVIYCELVSNHWSQYVFHNIRMEYNYDDKFVVFQHRGSYSTNHFCEAFFLTGNFLHYYARSTGLRPPLLHIQWILQVTNPPAYPRSKGFTSAKLRFYNNNSFCGLKHPPFIHITDNTTDHLISPLNNTA